MLFEYALQSRIQNGKYFIKYQDWTLNFWIQVTSPSVIENHTIFYFQNNLNQKTSFIIDTQNNLAIQNIDQSYLNLVTVVNITQDPLLNLLNRKTDVFYWTAGSISYQANEFTMRLGKLETVLQTHNYSSEVGTYVDFAQIEDRRDVFYNQVIIRDIVQDTLSFFFYYYDPHMLAYYNFDFISNNKQTVRNLANEQYQNIQITDVYYLPSKINLQYSKINYFSNFKILYPSFWKTCAFYCVQMVMDFVYIFRQDMIDQSDILTINFVLYHRQFFYSDNSMTANLATTFQYKNSMQFPVDNHFSFSYDYNIQFQDMSNDIVTYTQNFQRHKFIVNLCTQQQHFGNLMTIVRSKLDQSTFRDNTTIEYLFSDKDMHLSYVSDENQFFDVVIDRIFFYQSFQVGGNNDMIGFPNLIQTDCGLDDTIPFLQQTSMINDTQKIVLGNCAQTQPLQQCHSFPHCIECDTTKCLRCKDNFYIVDFKCLKCEFPFMIIDQNCIFPQEIMYYDEMRFSQPFQGLSELFSNLFQMAKQKLQKVTILRILFIKGQNSYQVEFDHNFFLQENIANQTTASYIEKYEAFYGNFFTNYENFQISARISIYFIDFINIKDFNIHRQYFCSQNKLLLNIQKDLFQCTDTCPINTYKKDNKLCNREIEECLQFSQNNLYNCVVCQNGYELYKMLTQTTCLCININQCKKQPDFDKNVDFNTNYYNLNYSQDGQIYNICDISLLQYFNTQTKNCQKNYGGINYYCTEFDALGNCSSSNSNIFSSGFYYDDTASLFNKNFYFVMNSLDVFFDYYLNTLCNSLIPYLSILYQNMYCINSSHYTNGQIKSCLLNDSKCSSCQVQDLRKCASCVNDEISIYQQYTICQKPLKNCLMHVKYNQEILCQNCFSGNLFVKQNQIYGICLDNPIDMCTDYAQDEFGEYYCTECELNYTLVNNSQLCIQETAIVQNCNEYVFQVQVQKYLCFQCSMETICVQYENQYNNCLRCIQQEKQIEGCSNYDQSATCLGCNTNYVYQQGFCYKPIENCQTYFYQNGTFCSQCVNDNYQLSKDYTQCVLEEICSQFDMMGKCIQCKTDYCMQQNKCFQCVQNCIYYAQDLCDQCSEEYILNRQNNVCIYQKIQMTEIAGTLIQECVIHIEGCVSCIDGKICKECSFNYYLSNGICEPNCLLLDQNCRQCNIFDVGQCQYCQTGYILYQQQCLNPCEVYLEGFVCLQKKCLYFDKQCIKCRQNNPEYCETCNDGYEIDEYFTCVKKVQQKEEKQQNCGMLCLDCFEEVCLNCVQGSFVQNGVCQQSVSEKSQKIIEEQQQSCLDSVLCLKDGILFNQHCKKCKKVCQIDYEFFGKKLKIQSQETLVFNQKLKNSENFIVQFDKNFQNKFVVIFSSQNQQKYAVSFFGLNLVQQSQNCLPQKFYQFEHSQELFINQTAKKVTQTLSKTFFGSIYNSINFLVPQWLRLMFIEVVQKIELFSYIGYLNLDGGELFNFMNSFSENYVQSIVTIQSRDIKTEYELQYYKQFYQIEYLNTFDELSVLSMQMFVLTILFKIIIKVIKKKKNKQRILIKELLQFQSIEFSFFVDSLVIGLSFYVVPRILRFFVYRKFLKKKAQIYLLFFDFCCTHFALKRILENLYFKNQKRQKVFKIFKDEWYRLRQYEVLLKKFSGIDQGLALIQMMVMFAIQQKPYFCITIVYIIIFFKLFLFFKYFIEFKSYIKAIIVTQIVQEFLFLAFLSLMLFQDINSYSLSFYLNIVYVLVNFIKFTEFFQRNIILDMISQDKLSHRALQKQTTEKVDAKVYKVLKKHQKQIDIKQKQMSNLTQQFTQIKFILYLITMYIQQIQKLSQFLDQIEQDILKNYEYQQDIEAKIADQLFKQQKFIKQDKRI